MTEAPRDLPPAGAGFTGAVLCGGESRRMGQDKALLVVHGRPMALRVADALRSAGALEVWAVGGDADALGALGLEVVADDEPGAGPLVATLTALRAASTQVVVVLACDLLRPDPDVVRELVDALRAAPAEVDAAVPLVDGHRQWTHAAWRSTARAALVGAREAGASSLRRAAESLRLLELPGIDPLAVADADTPQSLP